jgi:two-component system, OmpR family, alkaline phosphatase synthesis response regulator PhoP
MSDGAGSGIGVHEVGTILVVDDESDIRTLLRSILEIEGHYIQEAADGLEALSLYEELNPDVIVLDIMMPGLSGLDVLREIRGQHDGLSVPIMVLTALHDDATAWEAWAGGVNTFVTKPFDPEYLVAWVAKQLTPSPVEGF